MSDRILLIDDDPTCLQVWAHTLKDRLEVETALSAESALQIVNDGGDFAVVAADKMMPGIDGVECLKRVRELAPDAVRLLITADEDVHTAERAVNEAGVFRLLFKPVDGDALYTVLRAALTQYRVQYAETELFEKTLKGCVEAFAEVLSLTNPNAFTKASQVHGLITRICDQLTLSRQWEVEIAALLSQLGCVTISAETLERQKQGRSITAEEIRQLRNVPELGARLIEKIPRMQNVAALIRGQRDGSQSLESSDDPELVQEASILKAALALQDVLANGGSPQDAAEQISEHRALYRDDVVEAVCTSVGCAAPETQQIGFRELEAGMITAKPIVSDTGMILLREGIAVSEVTRVRLQNFTHRAAIKEPIVVLANASQMTPTHDLASLRI